jgi:hypothetical protein
VYQKADPSLANASLIGGHPDRQATSPLPSPHLNVEDKPASHRARGTLLARGLGRNEMTKQNKNQAAIGEAERALAQSTGLETEVAKLNAQTEEEVDALRVNLTQDEDSRQNTSYGTGIIADDTARDRIAGATEVGPELDDKGVDSATPGRDNTSSVLRQRHPNSARAPRDEMLTDGRIDESTAA